SEITAASQEQSGGIEQVNTAITQMDQVTQQNAALVEQAAAAAESLEEQARNLAEAVAVFKVAQGAQLSRPSASATLAKPPPKLTSLPSKGDKPMVRTARAPRAKSNGGGAEGKWEEF
ncbi:MAG TPA: hypothetical protein VLV56_07705, partial [Burkholderiales bacterium]|nr:hypothetical protein [Burkholderiales bacterium]